MNIVVVGGGKVGYYLTKTLLEHGHKATLIEENKEVCIKVANELDIDVICGDGTNANILECAKVEGCDALIGVTGRDENNLICCQIAKNKFNVKKTLARVNNPKNASILKALGVDVAISTTAALAHIIEREADNAIIKQLMSLDGGGANINEITVTDHFKYIGKKLKDIPLPDSVIIAAINRNGKLIVPNGLSEILEEDKLLIVAQSNVIHLVSDMFSYDK
ncbi:MAG: potassium channel family protein [Oscillospiraceae bacterium]